MNRYLTSFVILLACLISPGAGFSTEKLPEGIKWITNNTAPLFASPDAKKGGTYRTYMSSFPLTLRHVGPDANGAFANIIYSLDRSLLSIHSNTEEILPDIATHWAFGDDNRTMYFKLDPDVRWSDGKPVTADDFVYTLEFMRSKNIIAPFYNNYYTEVLDRVIKYDDYTIAVVSTKPLPELHLRLTISPTPRHFYGEVPKDFVRRFNWKIAPNTGPYDISVVKKGKYITLQRKKNWWGENKRYFKNRFNVDKIKYTVIRDLNTIFEYFKNNKIDSFPIVLPNYWHDKAKNMDVYRNGYVEKVWFYNDSPQPARGFWLNQNLDLFKDPNLRHAFAHAINMEKLLIGILRNDYRRLHNHYTGYGEYTNPLIKAREYSVDKVGQLMKKSGWARGSDGIWQKGTRRFSVKINYSAENHTQRLVVLKEEAKKAGIEMILKRLDGSTAWKLNLEKKHEVAWTGFSTSLRPKFWEHYHSVNAFKPQTNNFTNTSDPELDKLIEQYRSSLDIAKRVELSRQIQGILFEIGAFVPSYMVGYTREAFWRWWKFPEVPGTKHSDVLFDELGSGLFWLDQTVKDQTLEAMKNKNTFEPVTRIDTTFKVE
jgi:microcin C transport system substrate-binding protein